MQLRSRMFESRVFFNLLFFVSLTMVINSANSKKLPSFTTNITKVEVENESRKGKILCNVLSVEDNDYWFTREGKRITNSKKYRYKKNRYLRIKKITWTDAGEYVCWARNKAGEVSRIINVVVVGSRVDKITGEKKYKYFPVGKRFSMNCEANGRPSPKVKWYKNGQLMSYMPDGKTPLANDTQVLIFHDVNPKHDGSYRCFVWNRVGNISTTYTVLAKEVFITKPIITQMKNITAYEGDNVKATCKAFCDSLPHFQWAVVEGENATVRVLDPNLSKDEFIWKGKNKRYHGVHILFINVTKKDERYYYCVVGNNWGYDKTRFYLHVIPRPMTPVSMSANQTFSSTISMLQQQPVEKDESVQSSRISLYIVVSVAAIVLVIGSIFAYLLIFKCKKHKKRVFSVAGYHPRNYPRKERDLLSSTSSSVSTSSTNPLLNNQRFRRLDSGLSDVSEMVMQFDPRWEINRENLNLLQVIGEGAFGKVLKAEAFGVGKQNFGKTIVAVKTLKDDATEAELMDLISEAEVMKSIGRHKNINNVIGCCTQNGPLLVVVEYAPFGNLREYLRERRPDRNGETIPIEGEEKLCFRDFVSFSYQIARGMEYLSGRKCIHRDLAARNILVGEDRVMKIADFGLARDIHQIDYYRKTTDGRLPVKWMALEALFDRVYTSQSDVWSFGVVVWEIVTFGGTPYPGIPLENLFELLENGFRMEQPVNCPEEFYNMLLRCWNEEPYIRPTFTDLVQQLDSMLSKMTSEEYVDVGDLISPMQPINVQNHHVEPSSPSDVSTCSSVFEHTEHDFDEKALLQTHENVHQNVQNKPVLS
ncbi:fibroblast growth factor receptor 4-like isoform X2 [Xenia sp. Carnegie-2017]|uniref:fibroblast growth factor receptor 4-like isoform X2 n=1 Tax=Xenia sp. Carnegie-2017 TaxID=2897299 RepID=UPI001F048054|nr:fibroblast growth factor receptor 4-like isoform X2 [Xenia sp. Carnegie-2017]